MVSLVVNIKKDLQGKNMKFSSCLEEFRYSTKYGERVRVLSPTAEIRKLPRKKSQQPKEENGAFNKTNNFRQNIDSSSALTHAIITQNTKR